MRCCSADLTDSLIVYTRGSTAEEAVTAFTAGFDQLADAPTDPGEQQALETYYTDKLIKPIQRTTGEALDMAALLPSSNAQKYLQTHYTLRSSATSPAPDDAGDGSAWSAANARFNNYFREIATRFEYRDAMLLDTRGNVIYSVNKGSSAGYQHPHRPVPRINLGDAYQKAIAADAVDFVWITDFQPFQAAAGMPIAWLVSPIDVGGKAAGLMALPLPISKVNRIMTADQHWKAAGMGATAETYLAGPDGLMRSDSRLFLQDPKISTDAVSRRYAAGYCRRALRWQVRRWSSRCRPRRFAPPNADRPNVMDTGYLGDHEFAAYGPLAVRTPICAGRSWRPGTAPMPIPRLGQFSPDADRDGRGVDFRPLRAPMLIAHVFVRPIRRLAGRGGRNQRRQTTTSLFRSCRETKSASSRSLSTR